MFSYLFKIKTVSTVVFLRNISLYQCGEDCLKTNFIFVLVVEEPPYQVKESGVAPTDVLISVYLKYTMQPEAFRFQYGPLLQNPDNCRADSTCMFYDVKYPTRLLQSALRTSKKTASHNTGNTLTLLPNDDEVPPIRPMLHKRILELRYPTKRGNSRKKAAKRVIEFKLRKNLELAPPFQAVLQHVNQMCLAQSLYEKSGKALQLPPLWDPLYQLPVLPESLRRMLPTGQPDHVLT